MNRNDKISCNPKTLTKTQMYVKKVQVSNDQEMAQSERNSQSKNRGGKKLK